MDTSRLTAAYTDAIKLYKAGKLDEVRLLESANAMRAGFEMQPVTAISQLSELRDFKFPPGVSAPAYISPAELSANRKRALDAAKLVYIRRGWIVVYQDDNTVQLRLPKSFSWFFAFLWFLLLGIGLLVYLIYYFTKKESLLVLTVDDGPPYKVHETWPH